MGFRDKLRGYASRILHMSRGKAAQGNQPGYVSSIQDKKEKAQELAKWKSYGKWRRDETLARIKVDLPARMAAAFDSEACKSKLDKALDEGQEGMLSEYEGVIEDLKNKADYTTVELMAMPDVIDAGLRLQVTGVDTFFRLLARHSGSWKALIDRAVTDTAVEIARNNPNAAECYLWAVAKNPNEAEVYTDKNVTRVGRTIRDGPQEVLLWDSFLEAIGKAKDKKTREVLHSEAALDRARKYASSDVYSYLKAIVARPDKKATIEIIGEKLRTVSNKVTEKFFKKIAENPESAEDLIKAAVRTSITPEDSYRVTEDIDADAIVDWLFDNAIDTRQAWENRVVFNKLDMDEREVMDALEGLATGSRDIDKNIQLRHNEKGLPFWVSRIRKGDAEVYRIYGNNDMRRPIAYAVFSKGRFLTKGEIQRWFP